MCVIEASCWVDCTGIFRGPYAESVQDSKECFVESDVNSSGHFGMHGRERERIIVRSGSVRTPGNAVCYLEGLGFWRVLLQTCVQVALSPRWAQVSCPLFV